MEGRWISEALDGPLLIGFATSSRAACLWIYGLSSPDIAVFSQDEIASAPLRKVAIGYFGWMDLSLGWVMRAWRCCVVDLGDYPIRTHNLNR